MFFLNLGDMVLFLTDNCYTPGPVEQTASDQQLIKVHSLPEMKNAVLLVPDSIFNNLINISVCDICNTVGQLGKLGDFWKPVCKA